MREGLLPATVATVLELSISGEKARALTELLGEVFDPTETAISAFEVEQGVTTLSMNTPWKVEIYFATPRTSRRCGTCCGRSWAISSTRRPSPPSTPGIGSPTASTG